MSSMFERMVEWRNWMRNAGFSSREREGYSGPELRAIRAAKGVGRPHPGSDRFAPHINGWVKNCHHINKMAQKASPYRWKGATDPAHSIRPYVIWRAQPIFLPPMSEPWGCPMIDSTAALRKSKRRRGKG